MEEARDRIVSLSTASGAAEDPKSSFSLRIMKRKIFLFLCTDDYYRSRFAELLFNHLAVRDESDRLAISRALAVERGTGNIGSISPATVEAFAERGIPVETDFRYPIGLEESDLAGADYIVAVDQDEHFPMLERKFPRWVEQVEFWHVHDVGFAPAREALDQIDQNGRGLIKRVKTLKPRLPTGTAVARWVTRAE
jgi:protein-tyrosine phosphatase